MIMSSPPSLTILRENWVVLYKTTLPTLATSKDPAQPYWPIHLDHCFARIILDNAIGVSKPWTEVLTAPAVRTMSAAQLGLAIELGKKIARGDVDLVELDERSLALRGKASKSRMGSKRKSVESAGVEEKEAKKDERKGQLPKKIKTERVDGSISKYFLPPKGKETEPSASVQQQPPLEATPPPNLPINQVQLPDDQNLLRPNSPPAKIAKFSSTQDPLLLIASCKTLTPYRRKVLTLLCAVPRGQWTSYAAISDHITAHSPSKTCARAVGNAMRNNPFAPAVPCHRVLAADGQIGGFGGSWGEQGVHAGEKRGLLLEEGVTFDAKGRARGVAWRGWKA